MKNINTINILCATDENYAAYCGIMLTSLFENNKNNSLEIFLLADQLSVNSKDKFRQLSDKYKTTINLITPSSDLYSNFPVRPGDHVTKAAYYRISCGELLPEEIKKVIYLDCDIIVNSDLKDLWEISLESNLFGAVIDSYFFQAKDRLNLNSYFNSGVLVIDVDKFRKENINSKCLETLREDPEKIKMHDQDLLNIVAQNRVFQLSPRFNMMSAFLRKEHLTTYFSVSMQNKVRSYSNQPESLILHYEYFPKPWQKGALIPHPFEHVWNKYKNLSLWNDSVKITYAPLKKRLTNAIIRFLWTVKIKHKPQYYIC